MRAAEHRGLDRLTGMHAFEHRSAWLEHPNYQTQALLLESHDSFVAMAASLEERCRRIGGGEGLTERQVKRFAGRLADQFRNWQWAMACHERYEENKLYPFLEERFGVDCAVLADEHEALHQRADACIRTLEKAAAACQAGEGFPELQVLSVLRDYRLALCAHLDREEQLVIPLLLSMSPADFSSYAGKESCAVPAAPPQ